MSIGNSLIFLFLGQGCSMEQMEQIRDQQQNLAKLHFELGARQDIFAPLSEDGLRAANEHMDQLMERLETLSVAIGQLNPSSAATPPDTAESHKATFEVSDPFEAAEKVKSEVKVKTEVTSNGGSAAEKNGKPSFEMGGKEVDIAV